MAAVDRMTIPEKIEYHAAREIWRKRDQPTPSGEMTWERWFAARFGRTLDEAAEDLRGRR